MVIVGDSRSRGCGLESQHQILDGHLSHRIAVKIVMFVRKRQKTKCREYPLKKH